MFPRRRLFLAERFTEERVLPKCFSVESVLLERFSVKSLRLRFPGGCFVVILVIKTVVATIVAITLKALIPNSINKAINIQF